MSWIEEEISMGLVPTMSLWQLLSVLLQDQVKSLAVLSLEPLYLSFQLRKKYLQWKKPVFTKSKYFFNVSKNTEIAQ